jgi:hypothetical protein
MKGLRATAMWLVGAAIGGAFLWLALRTIDVPAVLALVRRADGLHVAAVVACALGFAALKSLRWAWLIDHLQPLSWRRLVGPVFAGTAANYGVPHAGELVRTWMVAARERLPSAALLASIAVERVFDFCAVLILGLLGMLGGRAALDALGAYLWVLTGFLAVTLAVAIPFVLWPRASVGAFSALLRPLPAPASDWVLRHMRHGVAGLGSLQSGSRLLWLLALSIAQWSLMAGCAWFSLRSIGVVPEPALALVTLLLLVVGLTLPAAPGHVGTTQIAFLLAAAPFGLGNDEAIAGSFVYNLFVPITFILAGVILLLHRHRFGGSDTRKDARPAE